MFKIGLIACGQKMPKWVKDGFLHYTQLLSEYASCKLTEVPLEKRTKSTHPSTCLIKESNKMQQLIPSGTYLIALDATGMSYGSEDLSKKLAQLQQHTSQVTFLIGGPDGIHSSLLKIAQEKWSLSALTLPHPLVRVILAEALYRAFSILHHHPYHR